jgi:hypothetical protein
MSRLDETDATSACAMAAMVARVAIDHYDVGIQYITFFPANMITSLISGFGAGFLYGLLSVAA